MDSKPYISRKDQSKLTKKRIYDTTILLIKKKEYSKITIREICQNSDISVGTFYIYFTSKDDILPEFFTRIDSIPLGTPAEDKLSLKTVFYINSYFSNIINNFDKEILRELTRISLSTCKDYILCDERILFSTLLPIYEDAQNKNMLIGGITPRELLNKVRNFITGYVYRWLIDEDTPVDVTAKDCKDSLLVYLSLFIND